MATKDHARNKRPRDGFCAQSEHQHKSDECQHGTQQQGFFHTNAAAGDGPLSGSFDMLVKVAVCLIV